MTLYLLFERLETGKFRLDTQLPVSEHAAMQPPTKLGLTPDQTITVGDAIGGLVTKSANDAAVVIAGALAGDEHEFAELMNRKAHALGMSRTVYRNASGLPNDEQVTTARDQALLGRAIQERFPRYYRYFAMPDFTYRGQTMHNHNHLLGQVEGLDGIKTGYTKASGFNLVTSVRRNNRHIVAVVLGGVSADSRDTRMRSLIEEYIVAAAPRKSTTATAEARKEPVEMRVTEKDATGVRAFAQALAGWDVSAAAAAPAINRFTDPFAVWNNYETAAVSGANAAAPRTTESGSLVEQPPSNTVVGATPANDAYGNLKLLVVLLVVIVGVCFCVFPTIVASGRITTTPRQYSRSTFCSVGASSAGCQRPTAEIARGNPAVDRP